MRLLHVIPRVDKEAAGPSYSVPRLCQALAKSGHQVELACIAAPPTIPGVRLDLYAAWPIMKRFEISSALAFAMIGKTRDVDVVHNHSLWSMVNTASGLIVPGRGAKLVTSPRGTLSQWALSRSQNIKRLLKPIQWRALERADLLHATSEQEYADIRSQGLLAPVSVIPNGVDVPVALPARVNDGRRRALFLGRIHPTKCIDRLLRAWQSVEASHSQWDLVIAGAGDEAYVREMQSLSISLGLLRVDFVGPLYGEEKSQAYGNADYLVLPSHSENFGMVVAESLSHACPVIASKGTPWEALILNGCGWWVEHDVETLAGAMDAAMRLDSIELRAMGERGRAWMQSDFSWESVAERMEATYNWIIDGSPGPQPSWIKTE